MVDANGPDRDLDVVVFGATGFVGQLVAGYLADRTRSALRVGLAGRSRKRLSAVREELGPPAAGWPLLAADAGDPGSLAALAARSRVVATAVGPYARYGLPLVEACAVAGTDYADITGELLFVRDSIDLFHETAAARGARVVHACGFDSIPSDLGVYALFARARADGAGELTDATLVVKSARGGVSGGTIDSLRAQIDGMVANPSRRDVIRDPYALNPERGTEPDLRTRHGGRIRRDRELGVWTGPFVMAPYNTRIVRRSNALQGWAYGRDFRYCEVVDFGAGPAAPMLAGATTAGLRALAAGMAFPPTRMLLDRVLPAPGEGPSEETRSSGHFRMNIHASTSTGARYVAVVAAAGDPGYAATSVMLAESALCLALDRDQLPERAGSLTPATAMDGALIQRLRRAGFRLSVHRV